MHPPIKTEAEVVDTDPESDAPGEVVRPIDSAFTTLIHARALPGEELRFDDVDAGDLYHGRADDGASTSDEVWEIVRFYRDADANILRARYRADVAWDSRDSGWT